MEWSQLLEQAFKVEAIMTPRDELLFWDEKEVLENLWEAASLLKVDTLPVLEKGRIVGMMQRGNPEYVPLTPDWIVSRDVSIPDIVKKFAERIQEHPCLFVEHRQSIAGIVTPADLNKLPARSYFYNLIAGLEMLLAKHVREHFAGNQQSLLKKLNDDEANRVSRTMSKAKMDIDIVHTLHLSQLVNIICGEDLLRAKFQFESKNKCDKHFGGIVELRNAVMHPTSLILDDYNGIATLNERIQRALSMLN